MSDRERFTAEAGAENLATWRGHEPFGQGALWAYDRLTASHAAEVERLREALGRANKQCEHMHHDKKERHGLDDGSPCPVEVWVNAALDGTNHNASAHAGAVATSVQPVVRHGFHHTPWDYCPKCAHYFIAETSPTGQQGCELAHCESVNGVCKSAVLPNKGIERREED